MLIPDEFPSETDLWRFKQNFPNLEPNSILNFLSILHLGKKFHATLDEFLRRRGMQITRFFILVLIKREEEMNLTDLANALGLSKPSATAQVKLLLAEKLIETDANIDDKRSRMLSLTRKGNESLKELLPEYYDCVASLQENLSNKEAKSLVKLFEKIL